MATRLVANNQFDDACAAMMYRPAVNHMYFQNYKELTSFPINFCMSIAAKKLKINLNYLTKKFITFSDAIVRNKNGLSCPGYVNKVNRYRR